MTNHVERKSGNTLRLEIVSREQFESFISKDRADGFAKTYIAKCNMIKAWDRTIGAWDGPELMGAITTTVSKFKPYCANLQLLHTFVKHRKKGVAKVLCEYSLDYAIRNNAEYFRVSAEPEAVEFYRRIGFKFWGKQKSGCSLSLFKINGSTFQEGIYVRDSYTESKLFSGRKGCVTELYEEVK